MKIQKILITGLACLTVANLLGGCSQNQASATSTKNVLNWNSNAELTTLDSSLAIDATSFDIINNSMEGLYRYTKNNQVKPALAKKTTISSDGLTYTIDLKKNTKWSNGQTVTAKDFVAAWQRTVDPKTQSQYCYLYDGILNANDIMEGKKEPATLGIKATSKYQLVITLEKSIPYFKLLLGFPSFYPQNQTAIQKYGKKYGTAAKYMVYNGPFVMKNWSGSNLSWKLVKNQNYWDKKVVKLQAINFKVNKSTSTSYNMYQDKQLDMTPLSSEQAQHLKTTPGYTVAKQSHVTYLDFNQDKALFKNLKIRQAIAAAINKKQLANDVLGGSAIATDSIVAKGLVQKDGVDFASAITDKGTQYNKQQAKKLWQASLDELGLKQVTITLLNSDTDISKKVSEYLQSSLEQNLPGLSVIVENVPLKTNLDRAQKGDYDINVSGWGADFADPITYLDLFTSDNTNNYGRFKNSQYDALIEASRNQDVNDSDKRWQDLIAASDLLNAQQGIVPLYQASQATLIRPNIQGLITNSSGGTYTWKYVSLK